MTQKQIKPGLLGKKIGMTQYFNAQGDCFGATVLQVGPCTVTQIKTQSKEGYDALQIGFEEVEFRRVDRPKRGHFEKKSLRPFRFLQEVRVQHVQNFNLGQQFSVEAFQEGDFIEVTGISKGKGFQGVIKRHKKAGGPASHGSCFHRTTGSIGQRTYPGKVFKLMKLPGHMGSERVTVKHLKVLHVQPEKNLLVVHGAIPGWTNALVMVRSSQAGFEDRLKEKKSENLQTKSE
jgi:large subunit ribosomal protein L3